MNHDNLLLCNMTLPTHQLFTIIKVSVGADSKTAGRQLKYHLTRTPYLGKRPYGGNRGVLFL